MQGLALIDTWQGAPECKVNTHISVSGATGIDRIYATQSLITKKRGVEVVAAAFTYHLAGCIRLTVDLPILRMGRGMWKMGIAVLTENNCTEKMQTLWEQLRRHKGFFPDATM